MKTIVTKLLCFLVTLTLLLLAGGFAHAAERAPNVVLIVTDNTGWGDWGAYGGGILRGAPSPHIDQLASEGMRLLNFNSEAQCTPCRSALMTGRHAIRSGTQSVPLGSIPYGPVPWEITLAETLKAKNYATGIFGKWHLGDVAGRFPTDQGLHPSPAARSSAGKAGPPRSSPTAASTAATPKATSFASTSLPSKPPPHRQATTALPDPTPRFPQTYFWGLCPAFSQALNPPSRL